MKQTSSSHSTFRELALYVDGELPPRQASEVKAHLEACWDCRLRAEEIENTVLSFTQFFRSVLKPAIPPPPRRWKTFSAKLRGTVAKKGRPLLLPRLYGGLLSWRFASPVATTLVFLLILVVWLHQTPIVSASLLLERASSARAAELRGTGKPVVYQKFRIRAGGSEATREVWNDPLNSRVKDTWEKTTSSLSLSLDLPQIFAANRFNWQDPLSAANFALWRDGLEAKTDTVSAEGNFLTLRTVDLSKARILPDGQIVEASLRVRVSDYHPVAGRFRIVIGANDYGVELTQEEYEVASLAAVGPALFGPPPVTVSTSRLAEPLPATVSAPAAPSMAELTDAEIAARYALHLAEADLGEPIEIGIEEREQPGAVTIRGVVESDSRRQRLQAALEEIPHLTLELQTEEELAREAPPAVSADAKADVVSSRSPIQQQLQAYFGDAAKVEEFSRHAFALTEALMARAWALRHLSVRFPAEVEEQLGPSQQQLIGAMQRSHRRAMQEATAELRTLLEPVLLSVAKAPSTEAPLTVPAGARQAEPLFDTSQKVERLTLGLLSGSGLLDVSDRDRIVLLGPAQAAGELLAALRELETQLREDD